MKPLILEFKEEPQGPEIDLSEVEYDICQNLNVHKYTREPAVNVLSMSTMTRTKDHSEPSDSDKEDTGMLMITETRTFTRTETADSDANHFALKNSLITATATRQFIESSDTD